MSVVSKLLRAGEGKKTRALEGLVPEINVLESDMERLSDSELQAKTAEFRDQLDNGADTHDLLVPAFAVVREASRRVIGQRHYDVQLMGGAALHFGWIAEMKTGEGKTLVSTLPVYLNGLTQRGMHVVTVNDYLAKRDAEWMGEIHKFLGITVGMVLPEIEDPDEKRAAYGCDVTYGTNTEFGFDYLRDNMARSRDAMVQRGHVFAIVDEVDSILIDEARTPLIISGPAEQSMAIYYQFAAIVRGLEAETDYEVDEEKRTVAPTEQGIEKVENALGVENLYDLAQSSLVHQLQKALYAKELYKRDKDYIVQDDEVKIVDEFTGRILEGRRWSDGLHQAVEAKENVKIREENHTWATVTLQNYFRMYEKLAGMTGTAVTEAAEFGSTYQLPVVPIPTNKETQREDRSDLVFRAEDIKFKAIVDDVFDRYAEGQPVLIGTASVEKSEVLSDLMEKKGIPHSVLNAKQHTREAGIVAQAGRLGGVTVATNMAGRGVDILLGGNPEGLARQEVATLGLDLESDEGKAKYEEQLKIFNQKCKEEGEKIRELGGLYVLGSERHEARRIDNQLRGRSGRQGDPGESAFYLSLEDDLMRLFATGMVERMMSRTLDDAPIRSRIVTKALERAQNTVEARNAEIRKEVLKYDEVMNEQRKVIYARRMQVLDGEDLREHTLEILESVLQSVVDAYCPDDFVENWDVDGLLAEMRLYYPTKFSTDDIRQANGREHLHASAVSEAIDYYETREKELPGGSETMRELERDILLRIMDQRWREHLSEMDYLREGIHLRGMGQRDPLVEWQREGFEMFSQLMSSVDDDFVKHVMHAQVVIEQQETPDYSRANYVAAEDPVQSTTSIIRDIVQQQSEQGVLYSDQRMEENTALAEGDVAVQTPIVKGEHDRIGRNEPCWCGSGKKYKLCHGR
jgi:preprotein translocase subunit SecA